MGYGWVNGCCGGYEEMGDARCGGGYEKENVWSYDVGSYMGEIGDSLWWDVVSNGGYIGEWVNEW